MNQRLDSIEFAANYLKVYFLENYEKDQKDKLVMSAVETIIKETQKIRAKSVSMCSFSVTPPPEGEREGGETPTIRIIRFFKETPDLSSGGPTLLFPRAVDKEDS